MPVPILVVYVICLLWSWWTVATMVLESEGNPVRYWSLVLVCMGIALELCIIMFVGKPMVLLP